MLVNFSSDQFKLKRKTAVIVLTDKKSEILFQEKNNNAEFSVKEIK